jgi:membrane protein DedA with SNARE-associated domain
MDWIHSLFSLQTMQQALNVLGYPAVTLFILIESMGVPVPGEAMILFASFYAATTGQLQLPIVIICAACGAIIGDNIGYAIGRAGGRAFAERFGRFFFLKPHHLDKAERFFARHGAKTVFFGRFITLLRIWAAFLAGMNRMNWRRFLIYNAAGGIVWSIYVGLFGYIAGRIFHEHFDQVEHLVRLLGWGGLALFIAVLVAAFLLIRWRRRQHEQAEEDEAPAA